LRVQSGGHAVPQAKIVERYWRSLQQLRWFLTAADSADIYDNSGAEPRLVARKADGEVVMLEGIAANLRAAILGA
jgi:predicted ABC-type ATPase